MFVGNDKKGWTLDTMNNFFVLRRVRVYTKMGVKSVTFSLRVYLPGLLKPRAANSKLSFSLFSFTFIIVLLEMDEN